MRNQLIDRSSRLLNCVVTLSININTDNHGQHADCAKHRQTLLRQDSSDGTEVMTATTLLVHDDIDTRLSVAAGMSPLQRLPQLHASMVLSLCRLDERAVGAVGELFAALFDLGVGAEGFGVSSAVSVLAGAPVERRYASADDSARVTGTDYHVTGTIFAAGDELTHDLVALARERTITLHIYTPGLSRMRTLGNAAHA
jgi:hypothetical protein